MLPQDFRAKRHRGRLSRFEHESDCHRIRRPRSRLAIRPGRLQYHKPPAWHLANFTQLTAKLAGAVDEVTVSFAQIYRKTRRNLNRAALKGVFRWKDPDARTKRTLMRRLGAISNTHQMQMFVCSQKTLANTEPPLAACIDAARLSEIAGSSITAK